MTYKLKVGAVIHESVFDILNIFTKTLYDDFLYCQVS